MAFEYHQHGNSPFHYSATIEKTVLEICPLVKNQTDADQNFRIGFDIDHFNRVIFALKELSTSFFLEPSQTEFGFMAIVIDPDGRKIELYKID